MYYVESRTSHLGAEARIMYPRYTFLRFFPAMHIRRKRALPFFAATHRFAPIHQNVYIYTNATKHLVRDNDEFESKMNYLFVHLDVEPIRHLVVLKQKTLTLVN